MERTANSEAAIVRKCSRDHQRQSPPQPQPERRPERPERVSSAKRLVCRPNGLVAKASVGAGSRQRRRATECAVFVRLLGTARAGSEAPTAAVPRSVVATGAAGVTTTAGGALAVSAAGLVGAA